MASPGARRLIFVALLVANCLVFSQSRYGQTFEAQSGVLNQSFVKREVSARSSDLARTFDGHNKQCFPKEIPLGQQCSHVLTKCPESDSFLSMQYLHSYFCASSPSRPFVFAGLLIWLVFLFSTLGISASDFFCPNLATIAQLLGLDENVAGVTFLAFGNGSPDVFSTYSAMRSDSGSLAIGELLGAASFIISCVVGSMCIIKPFQVERYPFLRDVGFFTVAVTVLIVILHDGQLHAWEAGSLVGLYILYVALVMIGTWWEGRRQERRVRESVIRSEYRHDEVPEMPYYDEVPYRDDPTASPASGQNSLTVPAITRPRAISQPGPPRLGLHTDLSRRSQSRSASPSPRLSQMPSFSLIGALEFRQVVSSLQHQAASPSLNIFESPVTPYPGGRYYSQPRSRPRTPLRTPLLLDPERENNPWDDSTLALPLNERTLELNGRGMYSDTSLPLPDGAHSPVPRILHTPASPTSEADTESQHRVPLTRRESILHVLERAYHILFPTLQHFRSKTFAGKVAALFAAPAVMALTVTLPVTVTPYEHGGHTREKSIGADSRLLDFEEEGVERTLIAEEEVQEELHELKFNKWLMAAQCVFAPLFCVGVLFNGAEQQVWLSLAAGVAGLACATMVAVFSDRGEHPTARLARCTMGFFVAVVWIMAIADEVVNVLRTFGLIFGLSDAIIGLTIFAVGNSLADLVANMSVAVFAPIMGFSACFGGPMLNMLLGVGISGSYIIHQREQPYNLHFSTTLLVSSAGLLAMLVLTLLFVPWNGFYLTRRWGVFLILFYTTIMITNIIVETHT
ncbi:hypothetical protein NEOLEDRAFT_1119658 [Neolentinus lepideus HHB14362 ss-1]|uniref:Sodium/calcium exchanger membrane region domain-containing protein n=1 Tax=Neolentinus lepideus HHB14362 ss-1 TaxID=1314782 RepID=A0A165QFG0_9AGAM|nr:hypothetical protein NEOLEDRAFT_1119658 [Neolentinus lepideus HHB14362 ss-1]